MSHSPEKKDAKAIFSAAIEYYMPHQWEAYIADACGEDEAMRQRVRELLHAHQQNDSLLDRDRESEVTEGTPITERPGTQIGPYKLLQEIGEGGFGVVYMAEQVEPVRRKVALKIIKPGMDTKQVIARFEAERQALAMMDHPNIAKVLDAGSTESGRPYFVMELVKGVPITEFCDTNKLPNRDRLELFTTVCRAIQHAHQKGVIHRDLKPSNVMVTLHDNKPMPIVIDFGVSKAISHQLTEKTLFTAYGQMVGTPAYMSPEQAQMSRMDIDTRSDIYSLGVMLYELLTGSTPLSAEELRGTAYAELQRKIRDEEAPKPSTRLSTLGRAAAKIAQDRGTDPKRLGQFLRGDLDWIVLKALDKERSRRYETANGLASDIERFLNDEAVEACPPSVTYQVRKFVGRNRGLVTTASAIAAAVLLGIAGTTYGMIQARNDAKRARSASREAAIARDLAKTAAQQEAEKAEQARRLQREADQLREDAEALVAQQLATRAGMERVKGDVTLAALLDAEALARDQGDPQREANHRRRLAADLMQCPRPTHLLFHDSRVADARYSHDGRWIATACDDGTVRVWDAVSGEQKQQLDHDGPIAQVLFVNGDKNLLAIESLPYGSRNDPRTRQHLWQWKSGQPLGSCNSYFVNSTPYRDLQHRTTYVDRPAADEVQLRSVVDGTLVGPIVKSDQGEIDRVASNGGMRAVLVTSNSSSAVGRPVRSFPPPSTNPSGRPEFPGRNSEEIVAELWNADSGARTRPFEAARLGGFPGNRNPRNIDQLYAPTFSDDQSLLAIRMGSDRGIGLIEVDTGEVIKSFAETTTLRPHQFSPENSLLACLENDQSEIMLLNIASGEILSQGIPAGNGFRCAFSPDGSRILVVSRGGDPQLWDTRSGKSVAPPMEHDSEVQEVGYSPDGRYLCAVGVDGSVRLWDAITGEPASPLLKHNGTVTSSTFSRDGSHLMVVARDIVWMWPIGWPKFNQLSIPLGEAFTKGPPIPTNTAVISPDGTRVFTRQVVGGGDMRSLVGGETKLELSVWDSSTGQRTHGPVQSELADRASLLFGGQSSFDAGADKILMNESGPRGIRGARGSATGGEPPEEQTMCRIWNLNNDERIPLNFTSNLPGANLRDARFSVDGTRVVAVIHNRQFRGLANRAPSDGQQVSFAVVWDSETGHMIGQAIEINTQLRAYEFSPDGRQFAYAERDGNDQRQIQVINTSDGSAVGPPIQCDDSVGQVSFCHGGRWLLSVTQAGVASMWNATTLEREVGPVVLSSTHLQPRVAVSPSTQSVAIYTDNQSGALEVQRRVMLFTGRPVPAQVRRGMASTVVLHQLQSNAKSVLQHEQGVMDVSFSPDSQYLLTTSVDGGVRVWDVGSGQLMRTLRPSNAPGLPVMASFSNDGQRIVTRAEGGVRVWEVATGQPLSPILQVSRRPFREFSVGAIWNASADRFLIATHDRLVVHDLSAEQREADQLQRMTQVLSGRRVNSLSNIESLASHQLQQQWQDSVDDLREGLIPAPRGDQWHRSQLSDTRNASISIRIWHLSQLIASEPNSKNWPADRGRLFALQNKHSEAIKDFQRAIANGASNVRLDLADSLASLERWSEAAQQLEQVLEHRADEISDDRLQRLPRGMTLDGSDAKRFRSVVVRFALGLAHLMDGKREAYETCCQQLLQEASEFEDFPLYPSMLCLHLLVPRSADYCDQLDARLRSRDPSQDTRGRSGNRFRGSVAELLNFRRGDFPRVREIPEEAIVPLPEEDAAQTIDRLVSRSPFLVALTAMAHHQHGDSDEARRLLELPPVTSISRQMLVNQLLGQLVGQSWFSESFEQIIRREANEMILSGG